MNATMIRIGNFFFTYRNKLFPIMVVALFALAPPAQTVFGSESNVLIKDVVAVVIALAGLAMRGWVIGYVYIKRGGLNKKVYAENLVTEGIFGMCRNPLYVGNVLIYIGVFALHGDPLVTAIGIALFLFIYQCIILAEEAYLAGKFGAGYQDYCNDVPRWGVRLSRFKDSTHGMRFNFGKAILKDYSTIATTLVMLALTRLYASLASTGEIGYQPEQSGIALFMACVIGWALMIRFFKKKQARAGA